MDEKIIKIVAGKLRAYKDQPMNQERLEAIREAVFKGTRTNKSASFANVKKWIKAARAMMKKQEKAAGKKPSKPPASKVSISQAVQAEPAREPEIPAVSRKVEESVNYIKEQADIVPEEVSLPKPTIVFDKVYLQSIKFEIAGIRQTMERVSRQLDKLEKTLSEKEED
ncbi:Uncharacterised protein [uncultured archaeon]|nr:Uncharacterised protein [uncultured archaeon]